MDRRSQDLALEDIECRLREQAPCFARRLDRFDGHPFPRQSRWRRIAGIAGIAALLLPWAYCVGLVLLLI